MERPIDHLVHSVHDLDGAAELYSRLGFTLTPAGHHPWGTSNRLVQFERTFVELLAVTTAELIPPHSETHFSFGQFNAGFLLHRQGVSMLALADDAEQARRHFADEGLATFDRFDFSRSATLPDGRLETVAFSLAFTATEELPDAGFFVSQHHNPEHVWKPEYQAHANGATRLEEVFVAADPTDALEAFLIAFARSRAAETHHGFTVAVGDGMLTVQRRWTDRFPHAPTHLPPGFAGLRVGVTDIAHVAALLHERGLTVRPSDDGVYVDPEESLGVIVEFATR